MFCHKCGAQISEGAALCHKCGTKVVYADTSQSQTEAPAPIAEPQQTGAVRPEPVIAENTEYTTSNNSPKASGNLHKAANIGRVIMWGSLALLLSFGHLPISLAIPAIGVAIGIILSALGTKRPWGLSKIIELVVAVILLVIIVVSTLSSGRSGDKYVQIVKDGTFEAYPQMTVGEAFDGFLDNLKWESGLSDDNVRFVNVTGEALYNDEEVEVVIQFIVDEKSGERHDRKFCVSEIRQRSRNGSEISGQITGMIPSLAQARTYGVVCAPLAA